MTEDGGIYLCNASNIHGMDSRSVYLTVKPGI